MIRMIRRMKYRLASVGAITALAFAGTAIASQPAQAFYRGHAYLVVFNSHCYLGGNVVAIYGGVYSNAEGTTLWNGGDWGDNIIWPVVDVGAWNEFNGYAWCSSSRVGLYTIEIPGWWFYPGGNNWTMYY